MAKTRTPLASRMGNCDLEELKGKTEFEALRHIKLFGTKKYPVQVLIEGRDPDQDHTRINDNRVKLVVKNGFVLRAEIG